VLGENLGGRNVIDAHARQAGIDIAAMHAALDHSSAYSLVGRWERLAYSVACATRPHGSPPAS